MTGNESAQVGASFADRFLLRRKLVEGSGKLRRFFLVRFRQVHIATWLTRRKGECIRCGNCCKIMFKCPHLKDGNHCSVYERRYKQCGYFPIDSRDLRYLRDRCGYRFENGERRRQWHFV